MTRVSDLAGAELALWVARANKNYVDAGEGVFDAENETYVGHIGGSIQAFAPHEDWSQGGPLIEKHGIALGKIGPIGTPMAYEAGEDTALQFGPTPLIAAMRALVASVYGDSVPDEVQS